MNINIAFELLPCPLTPLLSSRCQYSGLRQVIAKASCCRYNCCCAGQFASGCVRLCSSIAFSYMAPEGGQQQSQWQWHRTRHRHSYSYSSPSSYSGKLAVTLMGRCCGGCCVGCAKRQPHQHSSSYKVHKKFSNYFVIKRTQSNVHTHTLAAALFTSIHMFVEL